MNGQNIPALFVTHPLYLDNAVKGGVQLCTEEYYHALQKAGFDLAVLKVPVDRRPLTRIRRKLWFNPYKNFFDPSLFERNFKEAVSKKPVRFVFFNQRNMAPFARIVKKVAGKDCRTVVLSHGLESVDFFHQLRLSQADFLSKQIQQIMLEQQRAEERAQNQWIDDVFVLAPFEAEIERSLGAKSVLHVPRVVNPAPLDWCPQEGRIGFVGTIDQPVYQEGLSLFLTALQRIADKKIHVRLVGGPEAAGRALEKKFPIAQYAGALFGKSLEDEVKSWSCFVHPLFCYARGCSTKLAVAIGWEIPIATTSAGFRGYELREGRMPTAETPDTLAKLCVELLDPQNGVSAKKEIAKIAVSSPTIEDVAGRIRNFLFSGKNKG